MKRFVNYHAYLNSLKWHEKRSAVWERAKAKGDGVPLCELCGNHPEGGRMMVDVHHLTYQRLGDELPSDLIGLCRPCHRTLGCRREEGDPTVKDIRRFLEFFKSE